MSDDEDLPDFEELLEEAEDSDDVDTDHVDPAMCTHPPDAIEAYGDYYPDGWVCTECGHDLDGWELAERFPDHPLNADDGAPLTDGGEVVDDATPAQRLAAIENHARQLRDDLDLKAGDVHELGVIASAAVRIAVRHEIDLDVRLPDLLVGVDLDRERQELQPDGGVATASSEYTLGGGGVSEVGHHNGAGIQCHVPRTALEQLDADVGDRISWVVRGRTILGVYLESDEEPPLSDGGQAIDVEDRLRGLGLSDRQIRIFRESRSSLREVFEAIDQHGELQVDEIVVETGHSRSTVYAALDTLRKGYQIIGSRKLPGGARRRLYFVDESGDDLATDGGIESSGRERTCHVCGGSGTIWNPRKPTGVPPQSLCGHCGGTGTARYRATGSSREDDRELRPDGGTFRSVDGQEYTEAEILDDLRRRGIARRLQEHDRAGQVCLRTECHERVPENDHRSLNLGAPAGYCSVACYLEDVDDPDRPPGNSGGIR